MHTCEKDLFMAWLVLTYEEICSKVKVSIVHSKITINCGYLSGKVDCIAVAATCFSIPVVSAD